MDNIIMKIIEIEDKAQNIVKEARDKTNSFDGDMDRELENIKKRIDMEATKQISVLRAKEVEKTEALISNMEKEAELKKEELRKLYQQERDSWINMMFRSIVGSEL